MRKTIILVIFVAVVLVSTYFVFARDQMDRMDQQGRQWMMGQKMMEKCPMHMMMCKAMMDKQMTLTADGGVVVLAGNKIMKYDEGLNLVNEAELIDMEEVQQKMKEMMEGCPMMEDQGEQMEEEDQYQGGSNY